MLIETPPEPSTPSIKPGTPAPYAAGAVVPITYVDVKIGADVGVAQATASDNRVHFGDPYSLPMWWAAYASCAQARKGRFESPEFEGLLGQIDELMASKRALAA